MKNNGEFDDIGKLKRIDKFIGIKVYLNDKEVTALVNIGCNCIAWILHFLKINLKTLDTNTIFGLHDYYKGWKI